MTLHALVYCKNRTISIVICFCLVFAEGRGLGKENSHNICQLVFVLCNLCISVFHFQMKQVI